MGFNSKEEYEEAIRKAKGNPNTFAINKYGDKVKRSCGSCKWARFPASGRICLLTNKIYPVYNLIEGCKWESI